MHGRPAQAAPRLRPSPQPHVFFVALVCLTGISGLLALFVIGAFAYEIRQIGARQAVVRTLPDVRVAAPGELAILDGRIAASVPPRRGEFVAYVRERNTGRRSSRWSYVDGATPPLAVETGSRSYTIANSDYRFDRLLWDWTDSRRIDEAASGWSGAIRIQGLAARGPVMAVGRLRPEGGTLQFQAESLVGLSRATYFDRLADRRARTWQLMGWAALVAVLGLYFGWRGVRRILR